MSNWYASWLTIVWAISGGLGGLVLLTPLNPSFSQAGDPSVMGDSEKLTDLVRQVQAARKRGDRTTELALLYQLMSVAYGAGAVKIDLEASERYVTLLQELNRPGEQILALNILAGKYRLLGRHDQELATLQQLLALGQTQQDLATVAQARTLIGVVYRRQNDYVRSGQTLEQALKEAQQVSSNPDLEWQARTFLALTYELSGDLNRAVVLNQENLAFARDRTLPESVARSREAASLNILSRLAFLQGQYAQAIATLKESIALQPQEQVAKLGTAQALEELGFMQFRAGQLPEAEATLRQAIAAYEAARTERLRLQAQFPQMRQQVRVTEAEFSRDVYRVLQQVLIAQNQPQAALLAAESGRARDLVSLLVGQDPDPITLDQLRQIARAEQATLVQYSVIYDHTRHYRARFGWDVAMAPPTALYIWVIQPTGTMTFRSVDLTPQAGNAPENLTALVAQARESIGVGGRGLTFQEDRDAIASMISETRANSAGNDAFRQLYDLLIKPIAPDLPTDPEARVVFIPQDALFLVPFAALQDATGQYLIERHTILTTPAIQVLGQTRQPAQRRRPAQNVLVVGNPAMPSLSPRFDAVPQQLTSLPGAEQEARAIATLLKTQAITGKQATKAAVLQRMTQARIIHLATHGLLDDLGGFQSSLALAPAGQDQGFLTAQEISTLKLNADLVVLSACDTGRGKINGEGVVGLSRAFMAAGVPSVIVSLWQVPDAPTAELMTAFYQSWQTQPDKARALRQAMLFTLKRYPDPRDWAAFTLVGTAD